MQLYAGGQMRLQLLPDANGEIFCTAYFTFHEPDIQVQVQVIDLFRDMLFNNEAQPLYVENKTRVCIRLAFYRNVELIIMTMPVIIRAFAKHFIVLFPAPVWIIKLMRRVEMFNSCEVNHTLITCEKEGANLREMIETSCIADLRSSICDPKSKTPNPKSQKFICYFCAV